MNILRTKELVKCYENTCVPKQVKWEAAVEITIDLSEIANTGSGNIMIQPTQNNNKSSGKNKQILILSRMFYNSSSFWFKYSFLLLNR